jgi:hypothetical protein
MEQSAVYFACTLLVVGNVAFPQWYFQGLEKLSWLGFVVRRTVCPPGSRHRGRSILCRRGIRGQDHVAQSSPDRRCSHSRADHHGEHGTDKAAAADLPRGRAFESRAVASSRLNVRGERRGRESRDCGVALVCTDGRNSVASPQEARTACQSRYMSGFSAHCTRRNQCDRSRRSAQYACRHPEGWCRHVRRHSHKAQRP